MTHCNKTLVYFWALIKLVFPSSFKMHPIERNLNWKTSEWNHYILKEKKEHVPVMLRCLINTYSKVQTILLRCLKPLQTYKTFEKTKCIIADLSTEIELIQSFWWYSSSLHHGSFHFFSKWKEIYIFSPSFIKCLTQLSVNV